MKRTLQVKWEDPVQLAEAGRTMPGIEFLRAIRDGRLPAPPIARLLGFDLVEVEPGHAVFEVTPGEQHHADRVVVQTHMPAGGADTGRLRAIGKIVHLGKRVATAEGRLEDASGKLYAHATTTCIVL